MSEQKKPRNPAYRKPCPDPPKGERCKLCGGTYECLQPSRPKPVTGAQAMTTPTDMPALLPCPFCGGKALGTEVGDRSYVICDDCGAGCDSVDTLPQQTAVAAWNRRTALAASAPGRAGEAVESQIMNLGCMPDRSPAQEPSYCLGYKHGHRDARHAATELVAAFLATLPATLPAQPARQLTEAEIARAVRPLYSDDKTAEMALPMDVRTARAIEAALGARPEVREALTDEQIEAAFKAAGGAWTGDHWKIEDADLHPFVRGIGQPAAQGGE